MTASEAAQGATIWLPGDKQTSDTGVRWKPVAHEVLSVSNHHVLTLRADGVVIGLREDDSVWASEAECQAECERKREGVDP